MWYASALLRCRVIDREGHPVGTLMDLLASAEHSARRVPGKTATHERASARPPRLLGLLVETTAHQVLRIPPEEVERVEAAQIHLRVPYTGLSSAEAHPQEVPLAATVLNREVIDLAHRRVVVVNDLAVDETWHLLGLDGSPFCLVHWVLPQRFWQRLTHRFGAALLPWEQVVLVPADVPAGRPTSATPEAAPLPLAQLHPAELAELVRRLSLQEGSRVLAALDAATAAATLAEIAPVDQARLLARGDDRRTLAILDAMRVDEAADLLGVLPEKQAQALFEWMPAEHAKAVQSLLAYPEDSAGGLMTTDYLLLDQECTVAEAMEGVRRTLQQGRWIAEIYSVAEESSAEEPSQVLFAVTRLRAAGGSTGVAAAEPQAAHPDQRPARNGCANGGGTDEQI